MSTITISKSKVTKEDGVVVLPMKEYHRLLRAAVPTYYLTGKAARDLDLRVEEGLLEHREGKTIAAISTSAALKEYYNRHAH